ncbi:MAG: hypothetical protein ACOCV1_08270, partial [Bacillota bacterium]
TLAFSKKPELKINYNINKNINYNYINGYYVEKEIEGKKTTNQLKLDYNYHLNDFIQLKTLQNFEISSYEVYEHDQEWLIGYKDKHYTYKPEYQLNMKYNNFYWNNNYKLVYREGYNLFNFDNEDYSEALDMSFGYNGNKFEFNINNRYDFDIQDFKYINLNSKYKSDKFKLDLNTGYDFTSNKFYDLTLNSEGNLSNNLKLNNKIRYDLNNNEFKNIDSRLIYHKKDNLFIDYSIDYDLINEELRENKLSITKDLHCRELSFSYDFKEEKYLIEYSIDLFSGFSFSN